jgi:hypothetical protein
MISRKIASRFETDLSSDVSSAFVAAVWMEKIERRMHPRAPPPTQPNHPSPLLAASSTHHIRFWRSRIPRHLSHCLLLFVPSDSLISQSPSFRLFSFVSLR